VRVLRVERLDVFYGRVRALHGISLQLEKGEAVTIVGANGAGKTTLLRAIAGLIPIRGGSIEFAGKEIANQPPEEIVRLGISMVPEGRELFGSLTVRDNLLLGAYARYRRVGRREVERDLEQAWELFPQLRERQQQAASTLSGGEQQMLAIGRALMARPQLLLLDEPSLGLAPLVIREIFRAIQGLRAQEITLLLVEQNAKAAFKVADRGYVLEAGGSMCEARGDEVVKRAYLGDPLSLAAGYR
jgi:branched-chain amino acid transport system ATP-binding protein